MTMAIQSRMARIKASVGRFASPYRYEFSKTFQLAPSPFDIHTWQDKVRSHAFQLRKEQHVSLPARALAHDPVPQLPLRHGPSKQRYGIPDRKSVLLLSCNSSLSKRSEQSSAGARSAWNLAFRRGLGAGASIRFFGIRSFRAIAYLQIPEIYIHSNYTPNPHPK